MNINVGDIIRLEVGDKTRVWRVTGVYLGSVREENVIGLESIDLRMGACQELFVPMNIYELVVRHWNNSTANSDGVVSEMTQMDFIRNTRRQRMSKVEIDGVGFFEVAPEVAGLLQAVSEERDELKVMCLGQKTVAERPFRQVAAMAQVCLDLHEALGVRWGDDPYSRIRELLSLLPRTDCRPPNDKTQGRLPQKENHE